MIDWTAAAAGTAALLAAGDAVWSTVAEVEGGWPTFRNRGFTLSPLPLLVDGTATAAAAPVLERYVALLGKAVALFRTDPEVRRWYGLGAGAEALIDADTRLGDRVWVCRLDGYLEEGTERLVLLENNADAPAGTLFSARINDLVAAVLDRLGVGSWERSPQTYAGETVLLDVLRSAAAAAGSGEPATVAVLQPAGRANVESAEMVAAFRAAGVDAFLADPRDARAERGRATFAGRAVDACWNKVNTVGWEQLLAADPALADTWAQVLRDTDLVHVNPFGARYVAESKLTLAFLREPRFADRFSAEERALATALLPWSCRLTEQAMTEDGERKLYDDAIDNPGDYVLKEPYDIRGDGVTIGRATSAGAWAAALDRTMAHGYLVQRYTAPTRYPTLRPGTPAVVPMATSFDTYVLAGAVRGFGAKASLAARVNVFQGGQKLATHVTAGGAPAPTDLERQ